MVLDDEDLLKKLEEKKICPGIGAISDPYSKDSQVQPASLDLTIGQVFLPSAPDKNDKDISHAPKGLVEHILGPGQTAIVTTNEEIKMPPDLVGIGFPPSHVSVKGILMTNPGQIDPGYEGPLRFTVINMGRENYVLRKGDAIVSIMVLQLMKAASKDYLTRRGGEKGKPPSSDDVRKISRDFLDVEERAKTIAEDVSKRAEHRLKVWGIIGTVAAAIVVALIGGAFSLAPHLWEPEWKQPVQQLSVDVAALKAERDVGQLNAHIQELEKELKAVSDQVNSRK